MPDENSKTVTTTTDTKTLIVEQFGRAGPWALLAVLVLGGVGYEMDYFLKRYVQQSDETMTAVRKNTEKLTEAVEKDIEANTTLQKSVDAAAIQHVTLIDLLKSARDSMEPVGKERKEQTDLLRAIKEAVEKNRQP